MGSTFEHQPVLQRAVVELLEPVPAGTVVDATVGGGGHAAAVLTARSDLRLVGVDRDPLAVEAATRRLARFGERAVVVQGGFEELGAVVKEHVSDGSAVATIFDLGVSSPQLDRPERGFSYWGEAPLDMRMDSAQPVTAATVVNTYDESELTRVIAQHGEERYAARIAREIVARRPLLTTSELVDAIKAAVPAPARRRGGHPARRTFQAIRMEVNRELPNLVAGLDEAVHLLTPRGRMLVIAYHSLEDRLVKERMREWSGGTPVWRPRGLPPAPGPEPIVTLVTRRPVQPNDAEVAANPRSRSARLRAAERRA